MNKTTRIRILLWVPVVLWMAVIFRFSMENADQSSSTSGAVVRWLLERFSRGFDSLSPAEQFARIESWSFLVRKLAHFTVFAVLGFLSSAALSADLPPKETFLFALLIGAFYAVTDEIHQYFVPGRACQLRDVCIDTAGVLTGSALFAGLRKLLTKSRRK